MGYVTAIVVAAGKGLRFKFRIPKLFAKINCKPVVIYSLGVLGRHKDIKDIILIVSRKNKGRISREIRKYRIPKVRKIIAGGRRRQDSVYNGLKAINSRSDLVLIQDAARPFINNRMVSDALKAAGKSGGAVAGVPVKPTIKKIKNQKSKIKIVEKTLDRGTLWEAQTPQVFKKDLLLKAYARFGHLDVTDDASLVERLGVKVKMVLGSYSNIKITTREDLVIAQAVAKYA